MAYLQSNIPHFKCWVRKEYTYNHQQYHGEYIHALAIAVTCIPDRCLSFQLVFTGAETYDDDNEPNVHGGAMWARMPITALIGDTVLDEWPEAMTPRLCQPWDCSSRGHQVHIYDRTSSSPWICKIDGEFYTGKYMFTVDYTDSSISDDPAQHKQSHVLELTDAGPCTGNIFAIGSSGCTGITGPIVGGLVLSYLKVSGSALFKYCCARSNKVAIIYVRLVVYLFLMYQSAKTH